VMVITHIIRVSPSARDFILDLGLLQHLTRLSQTSMCYALGEALLSVCRAAPVPDARFSESIVERYDFFWMVPRPRFSSSRCVVRRRE
jgi:hypothetical protein